jgi:DNA-binding NtrC family response regulator
MRYPAVRKLPASETALDTTNRVTVLSVSPLDEDHSSLQGIVDHSKWKLFKARDLVSSLAVLKQHKFSVLLCERDLLPGTWIDVMEHVNTMPNAPSLIVASRLADDRLWAEALTLGAWDVLAKPFHLTEVVRSVRSAWQHWHDQVHVRATAVKVMEPAS